MAGKDLWSLQRTPEPTDSRSPWTVAFEVSIGSVVKVEECSVAEAVARARVVGWFLAAIEQEDAMKDEDTLAAATPLSATQNILI